MILAQQPRIMNGILWIGIYSKFHSNIVCSVLYRHPHCNLENFSSCLKQTMKKNSRENKYSISMGSFNIDLLNCLQAVWQSTASNHI